ncbi:MAG: hypothetical protein HZB35_09935 [Nitrospirae bacterium]|nr:hypothetical protein [Nitrospirota bacterium]
MVSAAYSRYRGWNTPSVLAMKMPMTIIPSIGIRTKAPTMRAIRPDVMRCE